MKATDAQDLERVLTDCMSRADLHGKLLNTFAMLENAGACKIHRFQRFGLVDDFVLQHAAEEARHAFFFKAKAQYFTKVPSRFAPHEVLAYRTSKRYLRQLDLGVNRYIKHQLQVQGTDGYWLAYLLVTLLIEDRAKAIYSTYERLLKKHQVGFSLRSLLAEEERHRSEIASLLQEKLGSTWHSVVERLRHDEEPIYQNWLSHIAISELSALRQ